MPATLKHLNMVAQRLGARVEVLKDGRCYTVRLEAPQRYVWAADEVHELVASCFQGPQSWKDEAIKDILERAAQGLAPCAGACDWCEERGPGDVDLNGTAFEWKGQYE